MSTTASTRECSVDAPRNRWFGIDFSGDKRKWSSGCSKSNAWIAELRSSEGALRLADLRQVQKLQGAGSPFERLANLLSSCDFQASGIEAPFSVPEIFLPEGGHKALLDLVKKLSAEDAFPTAETFANAVIAGRKMASPKPLRSTEQTWRRKGLNVRSTLWTRARGGAAMTAVCLSLLSKTGCPIWPWKTKGPGLLVEAFPAAQLKQWKLPFQQYNQPDQLGSANRKEIVSSLGDLRLEIGNFTPLLLSSADAVDAALCAFAAKGVSDGQLAEKIATVDDEGLIAVHV